MKINYQKIFKEKRLANIQAVEKAFENNESWLNEKFENHYQRWAGFLSLQEIKNDFQKTKTVKTFFVKEPGRQNLTEKIAKEFLEKYQQVEKVEILAKSGNNSWSIVDGKLDLTKNFENKNNVKSLDLKITLTNKKIIFIAHKYTNESGGAQDNQHRDLKVFIENTKDYQGNYYFAVLADGDYYNEKRIQELEKLANSKIFIANCENFIDKIKSIL